MIVDAVFGNLRAAWVLLASVVVTAAMIPFHFLARLVGSPLRKRIEVRWHKTMCALFGVSVEQRGNMAHPDGHGIFIAANHISWMDILVLSSLAPISFIAKDEVKEWPVFGSLAKWQDSIFVDRSSRLSVRTQAEAINQRLLAGDNIVLFPEGTTSDGNFIYPFKSSLFGALGVGAQEMTSPIQPVSIAYVSHHGLPMSRFERPLAAWPGDVGMTTHLLRVLREARLGVVVTFGEPIRQTEQMNRKQITALAQQRVAEMTSLALRGRDALLTVDKND